MIDNQDADMVEDVLLNEGVLGSIGWVGSIEVLASN